MNEVKCIGLPQDDSNDNCAAHWKPKSDWEFGETKMVGVDWPVISATTLTTTTATAWSIAADGKRLASQWENERESLTQVTEVGWWKRRQQCSLRPPQTPMGSDSASNGWNQMADFLCMPSSSYSSSRWPPLNVHKTVHKQHAEHCWEWSGCGVRRCGRWWWWCCRYASAGLASCVQSGGLDWRRKRTAKRRLFARSPLHTSEHQQKRVLNGCIRLPLSSDNILWLYHSLYLPPSVCPFPPHVPADGRESMLILVLPLPLHRQWATALHMSVPTCHSLSLSLSLSLASHWIATAKGSCRNDPSEWPEEVTKGINKNYRN